MKIGRSHLTYCSNIHAGETWSDVRSALEDALPRIRVQLQYDDLFAVGLRLSAAAARTLDHAPTRDAFRQFLADNGYYVPTINGFPYGAFHGTRVKEKVYEPDWRDPRRVEYSNGLARLLAIFASDAGLQHASISTVPGAFRQHATSEADVAAIAARVLEHAAFLKRLQDSTGVTITLAIEPEPACHMETVHEAVTFFRKYLLSPTSLAAASVHAGLQLTSDDVRRHVGLCLDACHMAVEFEDPEAAIAMTQEEGLAIAKVQLSSALKVAAPDRTAAQTLLGPFVEDTYLHQVVVSTAGRLTRYTDLADALAAHRHIAGDEWRVHFHVPIFLERLSGFETTQSYLTTVLDVLQRERIATCLEVETYTWDVLPPEYRATDMCSAIARELAWAREKLTS